jgi:hypothetical protein
MTRAPHLSEEQVVRYRSRKLAASELLELDSHLSDCEACRDLLYTGTRAGSRIASLRADLSGHLDYAGVVACASGSPSPEQRDHLTHCESCRAEVDDLRSFQVELRETPSESKVTPIGAGRRWRMPLTIAAGIGLVAASVWSLHRAKPVPGPAIAHVPAKEAPLAAVDPRFERAPILDRLITRQGTLLGPESEGLRFDLTGPMGTAVETNRPTFRWKALRGAKSYVVAVYDETFENVATSPAVTGLEWQPAQALPRGRVFNWQVTAQVGAESVHAPVPPAPEARFAIVPAETAAEIDAARRDHPTNHLLLAAMYAKAGALDDAERELAAVDPATAKPYLESLKRMR